MLTRNRGNLLNGAGGALEILSELEIKLVELSLHHLYPFEKRRLEFRFDALKGRFEKLVYSLKTAFSGITHHAHYRTRRRSAQAFRGQNTVSHSKRAATQSSSAASSAR